LARILEKQSRLQMNQIFSVSGAPPKANVVRAGEKVILKLEGDWIVRHSEHRLIEQIFSELQKQPRVSELEFDMSNIGSWDTSLLMVVMRVEEWCRANNVSFARVSLPRGIESLIKLSEEVPERKTGRGETKPQSLFEFVGNGVVGAIFGIRSAFAFIGETILSFNRIIRGKAAFDWRLFWLTMQECSAQALPIVGLISFLTGLIFAFVGAIQLRQFGAGIYVANLVAVAMAREMGAIMTGIIMAGRTGAAFAAQIGSMKVSEEIDALRTLAISPMDFLVSPRLLALSLMMPLLVLYSDLVGILGGAVVGLGFLEITWTQYWNQTTGAMGLMDIATGLIKSAVFGVIVAIAGCEKGMQCGNNAAAVGNAATSAVVSGITWIVASDAIIDVIQEVLKL
jgi:phospholipid/cholesterol/gamma-HCH transport system permease protein